jgi:predicted glycosyltransferase
MSQLLFENITLIKDLILAVGAINSPYHIVIKINPAKINDKDFIEQITKLILPKNKLITMELFDDKNDYHDYLCLSDVVLLTGGSVAFESVILGVPPIVYICHSQFSHNPMTRYPSSVFIVQNSASLSKALVDINNLELKNNKKENFDKPIRDIFGDINLSPKTELINKISNYLN